MVDWLSGACMLARREALDAVHGFDERFFLYWEDADLCWRLTQQGGRIWFEPGAEADHQTGASGRSRQSERAFHESAIRFYKCHLARFWLDAALVRALLLARAYTRVRKIPL